MPWHLSEDKLCVIKDGETEPVKCHATQEEAAAHMRALYAATEGENMSAAFQFAELQDGKQFDGMSAGKFTSFSGADVEIDPKELPAIVAKTKQAIASTVTESGETVGLPIDEDGHNHAGGAGWIVDVAMDEGGNKIRFTPRWTEIGLKLIRDNIRRFFSVSVDLANKVILGGSLTNWPATRNKDGLILLRPIELSTQLFSISKETNMADENVTITPVIPDPIKGDTNMTETVITPPVAPVVEQAAPAQEVATPKLADNDILELGRRAEELAQQYIKAEARKRAAVQYASTLVGGSPDSPYGLPVKADEIVALLLSLPVAQANAVQDLLTKTMKATVNVIESNASAEFNAHPHLPKAYHGYLKMWVDSGKSVQSFFAANVELGAAEDYNLSEFVKEA